MKYNQKKKKENIEIFLFIMVMAVFAAVLGVMSLGEKMQPVNQIRKISSGWYYYSHSLTTIPGFSGAYPFEILFHHFSPHLKRTHCVRFLFACWGQCALRGGVFPV